MFARKYKRYRFISESTKKYSFVPEITKKQPLEQKSQFVPEFTKKYRFYQKIPECTHFCQKVQKAHIQLYQKVTDQELKEEWRNDSQFPIDLSVLRFKTKHETVLKITRYSSRIAPITDALVCLAGCKAYENEPYPIL